MCSRALCLNFLGFQRMGLVSCSLFKHFAHLPAYIESEMSSVFSVPRFIYERVRRHGDPEAVVTRNQLGGRELSDPSHKKLALCLQQIGDELDNNAQLQRYTLTLLTMAWTGGGVTNPWQPLKVKPAGLGLSIYSINMAKPDGFKHICNLTGRDYVLKVKVFNLGLWITPWTAQGHSETTLSGDTENQGVSRSVPVSWM